MKVYLFKQQCKREGYERFTDYYLAWRFNSKVYCMRVKPQFVCDNRLLFSQAVEIDNGEPFEKYMD